jgi:hypothetical protein
MKIHTRDGEIGAVDQFYFDDEAWTIRYLVVDTGGWLSGRMVLISPISVRKADWEARRVDVALTKAQVENSPDISTHKTVSRQHEIEYMGYYGYPAYWGGLSLWGPGYYPGALMPPPEGPPSPATVSPNFTVSRAAGTPDAAEEGDSHLRSSAEVDGYTIAAIDGEIGHVDGFLIDEDTWAIRYIEVATRNWWPGKKVLLSPGWIQRLSWENASAVVFLTREAIRSAPEYREGMTVTREYEQQLYRHYGQPPYWDRAMAGQVRAGGYGKE